MLLREDGRGQCSSVDRAGIDIEPVEPKVGFAADRCMAMDNERAVILITGKKRFPDPEEVTRSLPIEGPIDVCPREQRTVVVKQR